MGEVALGIAWNGFFRVLDLGLEGFSGRVADLEIAGWSEWMGRSGWARLSEWVGFEIMVKSKDDDIGVSSGEEKGPALD